MDPNANLAEQRTLAAKLIDDMGAGTCECHPPFKPEDVYCLAELVQALDEWIMRGGFLPSDWQQGR